jgi:pimeloyl-ACP methyl ester carboxylesterase
MIEDTDYQGYPQLLRLAQFRARLPEHSFIDGKGGKWNYRDSGGQGRVVVLLPGAAGGGDTGFELVVALSNETRVVSVTYPGGVGPDDLASGLKDLLDKLALGAVALWGSSYGAWWSQAFACRYPEHVAALWLGNTFVDGGDVASIPLFDKTWLQKSSAAEVHAQWVATAAAKPPSALRDLQIEFLTRTISPQNLHGRLLEVASARALEPAAMISRVVISDCSDDPIIAEKTRRQVRARYPDARYVPLAEGGHYPHLVNVAALVKEVRRWLQ